MAELQPNLPFEPDDTLSEIRRLLETQNDLLRIIVDRLHPSERPEMYWDEGEDPFVNDHDDEDGEPSFPPSWFAEQFQEPTD